MNLKNKIICASLIAITSALAACGSKSLSGTYEGSIMGIEAGEMEFKSGNKVVIPPGVEMPYEIDGTDLKVGNGQAAVIFKINDDGSITGMGGMKFVKK
jgi:hypothetical protein